MLEFKDLIHFVAVYEERSFTAAARRLGTVQSAVSDRVQRLERDLGVPLFLRYHRSISSTATGALLYDHALRVMAEMGALETALKRSQGRASRLTPLTE